MNTMTAPRGSMRQLAILTLGVVMTSACGVTKQSAPALMGPSEFGVSITAVASPDQLPRDGESQSQVTVTVRDDQSRPISGQRLTLSVLSNSKGVRFSQTEVTSGTNGQASFAVVAPPPTAVGSSVITIGVVPVGGNFDNAAARSFSIALLGPSNTTEPTPQFTVIPGSPEIKQLVTFNASSTQDEGQPCGDNCTYTWDFDDGSATKTGRIVTHVYQQPKVYSVRLTVSDQLGTTASARQFVTVIQPAAPVVTLEVSPTPPVVNQPALFTANAKPAQNHTIRGYTWDIGGGEKRSTNGPSLSWTFTTPEPMVVTVVATDDLGQEGTASIRVNPVFGPSDVVAVLTASPSSQVLVGANVNFDAAGSRVGAGATIVEYTFFWNDGSSPTVTSSPTASHSFPAAGTYVVRVVVKDSLGRTATATISVIVV